MHLCPGAPHRCRHLFPRGGGWEGPKLRRGSKEARGCVPHTTHIFSVRCMPHCLATCKHSLRTSKRGPHT